MNEILNEKYLSRQRDREG